MQELSEVIRHSHRYLENTKESDRVCLMCEMKDIEQMWFWEAIFFKSDFSRSN